MRRRILIFGSMLIISAMLLPYVVMADTNISLFTILESSGNNYAMLPMISSINNTILAAQGKIAANGLNTEVLAGGTSIPHMVTDDKVLFSYPIAAYSTDYFSYGTKSMPDTSMPIIVGQGGYITTTDNAALEPGNNFSIVANGYIDTTAGAGKNIVNKANALVVNVDPSTPGTIDGGKYGYGASYPTVVNTNTNADSATTNHTVKLPASIVSGNLLIIYFLEYASGNNAATSTPSGWTQLVQQSIGNAVYANQYLYTVFYKVATGSEGATVTVTTTASDVSISESYQISGYTGVPVISSVLHSTYVASAVSSIPFSSLTPAWGSQATLWLENVAYENQPTDTTVSAYSTSFANGLNIHSGSGGLGSAYRNDTTATESPSSATMASAVFYASSLIGIAPALAITKSVSVAGISSGVHTITCSETTAAGGTLSLRIDSGTASTVTSAGSVFDNANSWVLDQNNVMPYINYYTETVGNTEVLKYQPNNIISGTVLPDLDTGDGTQNGAITFGSNPVGITETNTSPPGVDTLDVTSITTISAALSGNLTSIGGYSSVSVYFEYGLTSGMTLSTSPEAKTSAPAPFNYTVISLSPGETYYFRSVCLYGTNLKAYGSMLTFDTVAMEKPTAPANPTNNQIKLGQGQTYQTRLGPTLSGWLDTAGTWVGTDGRGFGGGLTFVALAVIMLILSARGYPVAGLALGYPLQLAAAWCGVWDWAFVGVTTFIFALIWVKSEWIDK